MAITPDLTEAEKYLAAILMDSSGVDSAEFLWQDPTNPDGVFRCWDFQIPWYRSKPKLQIDQASRAVGKALKLDTPIPTPDGWKQMGDIQDGDLVFGSDGRVISVLQAHDVLYGRPCYEVEFDDGSVIVADGGHLWRTWDKAARVAERGGSAGRWRQREELRSRAWQLRDDGLTWAEVGEELGVNFAHALANRPSRRPAMPEVRTTAEIARTLRTPDGESNHSIPVAGALQLPESDLPLDPYLLGIWLGDGSARTAVITTEDSWVLDELERRGFATWRVPSSTNQYRIQFPGVDKHTWKQNSVTARLRQLNVLENKHIPLMYLRASESQRRDLLAGLMDSDGTISHDPDRGGSCEITQVRERLARDIFDLLMTLGEKPHCNKGVATLDGVEIGPKFRVCWRAMSNPSLLPRKAEVWRPMKVQKTKVSHRRVVAVRPVASVPVRCLTVDASDALFLAGEAMVPTHNTVGIGMRAFAFPFCFPGEEMLLTAPELIHLDPITRKVEERIFAIRLTREMLNTKRGSKGIVHRPFEARFLNGAKIVGRIPQKDGRGVKGAHPKVLEVDEGQDYPEAGFLELIETLKYGDEEASWRVHGVTRGVRDFFWKLTQPDSGWHVNRPTAMHRPDWSDEERASKEELYGSRYAPDYRRNILGQHGDASSPLFVLARLMACVDSDQSSDYNQLGYQHFRLTDEKLRDSGLPISALVVPTGIHRDYDEMFLGADIGLTSHPTEILGFAEERKPGKGGGTMLRLVLRVHLERISVPDQYELFCYLTDFYRPRVFAMDRTGLGLPLYQLAVEGDHRGLSRVIRGYDFGSKVPVGFESEPDEHGESVPIMANVLEHASDTLRILVDRAELALPWDIDLLREFQGTSYTVKKSTQNPYGRKVYSSSGGDHGLDAARMAVLGWKQRLIEEMLAEPTDVFEPVLDSFVGY